MAVASSSQTMHPTAWYWHQEHWKGPKALTNHVEQLLDSPEQAQTTKAPNHNPAVSCQTPHDGTRAFYTAWWDHTLYIAGRLNVAACWIMFLALLLIASSWSFWKQSFYCCCFPNVWAVHTHTHSRSSHFEGRNFWILRLLMQNYHFMHLKFWLVFWGDSTTNTN